MYTFHKYALNENKIHNPLVDCQGVQRSRRGQPSQLSVKPPRPPVRQRLPAVPPDSDNMAAVFPFPAAPPSSANDQQWISTRRHPSSDEEWILAGQPETTDQQQAASSYLRWVAARRQRAVGTSSSPSNQQLYQQQPHHHGRQVGFSYPAADERVSLEGGGGDLSVCIGLTVQCSPVVRTSAPMSYPRVRAGAPRYAAGVVDPMTPWHHRDTLAPVRSCDNVIPADVDVRQRFYFSSSSVAAVSLPV